MLPPQCEQGAHFWPGGGGLLHCDSPPPKEPPLPFGAPSEDTTALASGGQHGGDTAPSLVKLSGCGGRLGPQVCVSHLTEATCHLGPVSEDGALPLCNVAHRARRQSPVWGWGASQGLQTPLTSRMSSSISNCLCEALSSSGGSWYSRASTSYFLNTFL